MHFFKEDTVSISLILVPDANRPCPMFPAACSVAVPGADAATASIPGRLGVTSRQRLPCFQEWVANLYMHSVRVRSLPRILALLGCGVGIAMLWRDVEAVGPSRVPDPQAALPRWPEWTRLGCPSVPSTARWPWFWDRRVHGWTCG